jgi:hypothetical protein
VFLSTTLHYPPFLRLILLRRLYTTPSQRQVKCAKLLATSYLSFVNIYFLKINGKSSVVQVAKQDGWQGKWTELFYFLSYFPSPTTPTYQPQATCLLLGTCKHALTSVYISCGQFVILCRRSYLSVILLLFCIILKISARWNDETTCKFVQLYRANECLRNMYTSNISFTHSFTHRRL